MTLEIIRETIALKDGRTIVIETGQLARQADGAVVVRMGDTMLLSTIVVGKESKEGLDFLPLTVDYREKYAAGGKIPGGFIKREGRPSDEEILTMRLVDRMLRPLFPSNFHREVQVMISLLSYDKSVLPDGLAGLAASTALAISGIPFNGPVSEVRVIRVDGQFIVNPGLEQVKKTDMDLVVAASKDSVIMVEGEMKEVSEYEIIQAIQEAHEVIKLQIEAQLLLVKKCPSKTEQVAADESLNKELKKKIFDFAHEKIYQASKKFSDKKTRSNEYEEILKSFKLEYSEEELQKNEPTIDKYYSEIKKDVVRKMILEEKVRLDGRTPEQIRPIWSQVDYLPGVHGSAVFTRGETQSLTTVTLGSSLDANRIDNAIMEDQEKFYLHYNFPPFSTGEVRPLRGVSRREVGHGNLAQRALKNVISDEVPYTIRVVSDILESNGSSSMATVCAATLALMDAGVSIKRPVSGIAMGLIINKNSGKWVVLSDILGDEDHLGDMDFKVTGTESGITACQMDIKIGGLTYDILEKALNQAREGRFHILKRMLETISESRKRLKPNAPKIFTFDIPRDFIGAVIGPGGKVIQEVQADTETTIFIEEKGNLGLIEILGKDYDKIDQAVNRIKAIAFIPQVGEVYKVKVKAIKEFGAFVELAKGVEGLLHISEIEHKRLNKVEDALRLGDEIDVKLLQIDQKNGKMRLSRKALLSRPQDALESSTRE
ncbi:MAG: polyribonucleotide nucleotidyltransferase [Flavobacteriales bacterium Tduv]